MKAAFRHILLAALLLRALMPLGWMPGQAHLGEAAFVICAADGTLQHGVPGKDENAKPHQPCAFAALQAFDLPAVHAIAPPSSLAPVLAAATGLAAPEPDAALTPHSPRAPPLTA